MEVKKYFFSESELENSTVDGYSPVREKKISSDWFLSKAGHVKPCLNLGGPPSKAKYELMTDSELVP